MVSLKGTRMEAKAAASSIQLRLRMLYRLYMLLGLVIGMWT